MRRQWSIITSGALVASLLGVAACGADRVWLTLPEGGGRTRSALVLQRMASAPDWIRIRAVEPDDPIVVDAWAPIDLYALLLPEDLTTLGIEAGELDGASTDRCDVLRSAEIFGVTIQGPGTAPIWTPLPNLPGDVEAGLVGSAGACSRCNAYSETRIVVRRSAPGDTVAQAANLLENDDLFLVVRHRRTENPDQYPFYRINEDGVSVIEGCEAAVRASDIARSDTPVVGLVGAIWRLKLQGLSCTVEEDMQWPSDDFPEWVTERDGRTAVITSSGTVWLRSLDRSWSMVTTLDISTADKLDIEDGHDGQQNGALLWLSDGRLAASGGGSKVAFIDQLGNVLSVEEPRARIDEVSVNAMIEHPERGLIAATYDGGVYAREPEGTWTQLGQIGQKPSALAARPGSLLALTSVGMQQFVFDGEGCSDTPLVGLNGGPTRLLPATEGQLVIPDAVSGEGSGELEVLWFSPK